MAASVSVPPTDISPRDANVSTRDAIVQAALQLFAKGGYEGTSLNDIAATVGIRRPSLLHHFPSKDALYEDVFEKLLSDWLERIDDAIASTATGWEKFEIVVRAGFELFEENPDYVRIMRREALDGGVHLGIDLSAVIKPLFDAAVSYLEKEMKRGTFHVHDARHLLITGYGAILTYFSDAPFIDGLLEQQVLSREAVSEHCDAVIAFFHSALVSERSLP
jgi:AcrR family transcriptional regulator